MGQDKKRTVGILVVGLPDPSAFLRAFKEGLREMGYTEVRFDIRPAEGKTERLPELVADLCFSPSQSHRRLRQSYGRQGGPLTTGIELVSCGHHEPPGRQIGACPAEIGSIALISIKSELVCQKESKDQTPNVNRHLEEHVD